MKKNIRLILLGELIVFLAAFVFMVLLSADRWAVITYFFDFSSLLILLIVLIPGLLIMGVWKDFIKAFSVGIRHFSLLELKNITQAVDAAQKLTIFGALIAMITEAVIMMGNLRDFEAFGPNLAVILLAALYAVIMEFFLFPLKLNAERKMNEEMDLGDD